MPRGRRRWSLWKNFRAGDQLHPEERYREREKTELEAMIDPSIVADVSARSDRTLRPRR